MIDSLAEIKQLYFRATRATIARDFDRAIDLLKSLPTEDARERATVYMQGLAEMKTQWGGKPESAESGGRRAEPVRRAKFEVRSRSGVRATSEVRPTSEERARRPDLKGSRKR